MAEEELSADTVADEYYKIVAVLRTETPDSSFHVRISFAGFRLGKDCMYTSACM